MELLSNQDIILTDNYKHIYIFGDSHCLCFGQNNITVDNKYIINS